MIRVELHEQRVTKYSDNGGTAEKSWVEILKITSDDPKIVAAALRGAANKYDPPEKVHR